MSNLKSLSVKIKINESKTEIWDLLFNRFGEVNNFNPLIESSHDLPGVKGEVGCERQCNLDEKGEKFLQERITGARGNESFDVEIFDGGLPMMDKMNATFNLKGLNPDKTEVEFVMNYMTKPKFMAGMMKKPMSKRLKTMLIGLKYHTETGNIVTKSNISTAVREYNSRIKKGSFNYASNKQINIA